MSITTACDFPGCGRQVVSYGLCSGHNYHKKRGQELRPLHYKRPISPNNDGTFSVAMQNGRASIIDAIDVPVVGGINWFVREIRGCRYVIRNTKPDGIRSMHRLIMLTAGVVIPDGSVIDHANGDGLDNRRSNLRVATIAENVANRRAPARPTREYRGVRSFGGGYEARISCKRINEQLGKPYVYLGFFKTAKEASDAYQRAAKEFFGEFATNRGRE